MANEFKVKKGLVVNGSGSVILDVQGSQGQLLSVTDRTSGSLFSVNNVSGTPILAVSSDDSVKLGTFNKEAIKVSGSNATITGSFTGSLSGSLFGTASWASNATTASFATNAVSASFATNAANATSASFASTASSADNFLVRGTLTAQTIVAQTITSSTDFVTGSTRFGSSLANTHQFTGSVSVTGSLTINGDGLSIVNSNASYVSTIFRNLPSFAINITDTVSRSGLTVRPSSAGGETITFSRNANNIQIQSVDTGSNVQSLSLNPFGGNVSIGKPLPTFNLDISGSTVITGSLTVTQGITGSLFGTSSWAQNAVTSSYILNAVSASFASTASFVNTLNQSVIISGSLTVGQTTTGAGENTLTLGPAPAGGAGEGGQILLAASGGLYTSASMLDNWQNQTRLLRGTNAGSDAVIASFNMHSGQITFPRYSGSGAFSGSAVANLSVDSNGNVITTAIGSSLTGGATNYVARWASATTLTTGSLFDNGTNVGIGSTSPAYKLDVVGDIRATGAVYANANGTMYFRGGDDAELWDINVANTIGIFGQQDQGVASIKLGNGGGTISGRSGSIGINITTPTSASLHVSGNVFATSFTGSLLGTATTASYVLQAVSASFATNAVSASFAANAVTASYVLQAVSASFSSTASSADNFLVRGTLTAQTIVAQVITSSTDFVTGSTRFGSSLANTHQFTGSVSMTGSLLVNNSLTLTGSLLISGSSPLIQLGSTTFVGDITNPAITFGSTSNGIYTDSSRVFFKAGGSFAGGFSSAGLQGNQIQIRNDAFNDLTTAMYIPYRLNAIGLSSGLGGNDTGAVTLITSGSVRLYISSSGNIGIGTTAPDRKLSVSGSIGAYVGNNEGAVSITVGEGSTGATGNIISLETNSTNNTTRIYNSGTSTPLYIGSTGTSSGVALSAVSNISLNINNGGDVFAGTTALFVSASGNVGIGTTAPTQKLDISGNVSIGVSGATTVTSNYNSTTRNQIVYTNNSSFEFFEGASERMRLAAGSGNLGIGTTSPSAKLDVNGNAVISGSLTVITGSNIEFQVLQTGVKLGNAGTDTITVTGSLNVSSSNVAANLRGSGSAVFSIDGTSGRLFQVDDSLTGSLFSVNTAAGLPIIEAFSDNTVRIGQYGRRALFVSQSAVGIGKETLLNGVLDISGSANITGSLNVSGSITGSLFGTASWANNATTSSYVLNAVSASFATNAVSASYVLQAVSASFATNAANATSASFASTASSADNFLVRGTLTAQTIVAQVITSSTDFVTGSTRFGTLLTNTHQFTGSVSITGSLNVVGTGITGSLFGTSSWAQNAVTSSYVLNAISSSFASTASNVLGGAANYIPLWNSATTLGSSVLYQSSSNISIGGTNPQAGFRLDVSGWTVLRGEVYSSGNIIGFGSNTNYQIAETGNTWLARATGNVGIGLSSPTAKLHISGSNTDTILQINSPASASILVISGSGNVGIGTTGPSQKLHVFGGVGRFDNVGAQLLLGTSGVAGAYEFAVSTGNALTIALSGVAERMRIASDGNVGIGTTSPNYKLDVVGAGKFTTGLTVSGNGGAINAASRLNIDFASGNSRLYSLGANSSTKGGFEFHTNSSDGSLDVIALKISSDGNVGIGTTSPSSTLHINGGGDQSITIQSTTTASTTSAFIKYIRSTTGSARTWWTGVGIQGGADDSYSFYDQTAGAERMRINNSGNVGIGTTAPARLLHIRAGAGAAGAIRVDSDNGNVANVLEVPTNGDWSFSTNSQEVMRLSNASGGRVGIGTTSPTAKLHISGSNTDAILRINSPASASILVVSGSGNVGINTSSPQAVLHSIGSGIVNIVQSSDTVSYTQYYNTSTGTGGSGDGLTVGVNGTDAYVFSRESGNLILGTSATEALRIASNGSIGIGTTSPAYKLDVAGSTNTAGLYSRGANLGFESQIAVFGANGSYQAGYYLGATNTVYAARIGMDVNSGDVYVGAGTTSSLSTIAYFKANGNVGIGTTSPTARLHVSGTTGGVFEVDVASAVTALYVSASGNVGIGTTIPSGSLDIYGTTGAKVRIGFFTDQGADDPTLRMFDGKLTRPAYSFTSDNTSGMFGGSGFVAFSTSANERMRITSGGNVGIGTTTPTLATLQVNGNVFATSFTGSFSGSFAGTITNATSASFASTASFVANAFIQGGNSFGAQALLGTNDVQDLAFETSGSIRMTISGSNGNVGIGTTSPTQKLSIGASDSDAVIINSAGKLYFRDTNTYINESGGLSLVAGSTRAIIFSADGSERMRVAVGGNVGIGTTSPATKLVISNAGASGLEIDPTGGISSGVLLQAYNRSTSAYMAQSYYALSHTFNVGSAGGTRALDITSGGNVGIGTTSPSTKLHVAGGTRMGGNLDLDSSLKITGNVFGNSGTEFTYITMYNSGDASINMGVKHPLSYISFEAGNGAYTERMRITNTGNVGIGTTSPGTRLDVSGNVRATSFTGSFSGSLTGLASNATSASYAATASYSQNLTVGSTLVLDATLTDYASVAASSVGSNNLFSQNTSSYTSAFFKYTAASASNARSGEVVAVWNGTTVQFTDFSTVDVGTTTAITSSVVIVTGQVQFNMQTNTSGWAIKSIATFM